MTDILWTAQDLAQAAGGTMTEAFSASGISIDTRSLRPGEVYLALQGLQRDGHDFVSAALAAGAAGAIVRADFPGAGPLLRVDDTLAALNGLGAAARARVDARVIGVTGSAGKTGTKEMLAVALAAQGSVHASMKSYNNQWGVPFTLSNMPPATRYAVLEMGMNHAGELRALAALVRPHVAVVTTVEPAHMAHFPGVEAIADAKGEIFTGMEKGGTAILNRDNPHFLRLRGHALAAGVETIIGFGEDEAADSRMTDCALHADSSRFTAEVLGLRVKCRIGIPGKHIALNALAALTAVQAAGGDVAAAAEALRDARPVAGRGNRLSVVLDPAQPPVTVIDESYNANPASMAAALGVLEMAAPAGAGRRIAVLGDMLELGPGGPQLHAALANPLLKARADLVFCCGAQMDALYQLLPPGWRGGQAADSRELAGLVTAALRPGDVVLVKGSLGSKMSYVIHALQSLHAAAEKEARGAV